MATMLLFYIIQKYYEKVPHFSQSMTTYHFRTKTWCSYLKSSYSLYHHWLQKIKK